MYNMYESSSMEDFNKGNCRLACKDAEYSTARTIARNHCSNGSAFGCKIYNCGTGMIAGIVINDGSKVRTFNVIEDNGFSEVLKGYCKLVSSKLLKYNYLRDARVHIITISDNNGKVQVSQRNRILMQDALAEKGVDDLVDDIISMISHINEAGHPVHSISFPTRMLQEKVMWEYSEVEEGAVNILVKYSF